MDIHSATEEAYKKGYEDGKREGIVHCKDCKYYTPYCRVCNHPKLWTTEEAELDVTDNDFCSYAERTTT
jgi:hypothetical protein